MTLPTTSSDLYVPPVSGMLNSDAISIERFRVNVRILYVQRDAANLPPLRKNRLVDPRIKGGERNVAQSS